MVNRTTVGGSLVALTLAVSLAGRGPLAGLFAFTAETAWTDAGAAGVDIRGVWDLVTDFEGYSGWNTFTTSVTSGGSSGGDGSNGGGRAAPTVGDPVELGVTIGMPWPVSLVYPERKTNLTLDFTWLDWAPPALRADTGQWEARFCWGIRNRIFLLDFLTLRSFRCCSLRQLEAQQGGVQVKHSDLNEGLLAPLVAVMFREPIEAGFWQMNRDLTARLAR